VQCTTAVPEQPSYAMVCSDKLVFALDLDLLEKSFSAFSVKPTIFICFEQFFKVV